MKNSTSKLRMVVSGILIATSSVCLGQAFDPSQIDFDDPDIAKTIRVKYVHSAELPDAVAFASSLRMVKAMHARDPNMAYQWLKSSMELDADSTHELVGLMLQASSTQDDQIKVRSRTLACDTGVPIATGDQVFSVLESMDNARDDVALENLIVLKGKLGANTAGKFQQWLDKRKVDIVHVKSNHRETYKAAGISADATIAGICNELGREAGEKPE